MLSISVQRRKVCQNKTCMLQFLPLKVQSLKEHKQRRLSGTMTSRSIPVSMPRVDQQTSTLTSMQTLKVFLTDQMRMSEEERLMASTTAMCSTSTIEPQDSLISKKRRRAHLVAIQEATLHRRQRSLNLVVVDMSRVMRKHSLTLYRLSSFSSLQEPKRSMARFSPSSQKTAAS